MHNFSLVLIGVILGTESRKVVRNKKTKVHATNSQKVTCVSSNQWILTSHINKLINQTHYALLSSLISLKSWGQRMIWKLPTIPFGVDACTFKLYLTKPF